jgi:hypothetical protein
VIYMGVRQDRSIERLDWNRKSAPVAQTQI